MHKKGYLEARIPEIVSPTISLGHRSRRASFHQAVQAQAPVLLDWISLLKWIEVDGDDSIAHMVTGVVKKPELV